jgi:uncharacterized protein YjiS (DUF1127 family)
MSNRLASAQVSERVPAPTFEYSREEYVLHLHQANLMRGELMADMLVKFGRWISRLVGLWQQSVADGRAMRELAGLDDRMLADIGVTRSDIPGLVRRMHTDVTPEFEPAKLPARRMAA